MKRKSPTNSMIVNIEDVNTDFFYCDDCKLYWRLCEDDLTEFRMFVFTPYDPKKCKFCSDLSIKVPKNLVKFRKKSESF